MINRVCIFGIPRGHTIEISVLFINKSNGDLERGIRKNRLEIIDDIISTFDPYNVYYVVKFYHAHINAGFNGVLSHTHFFDLLYKTTNCKPII